MTTPAASARPTAPSASGTPGTAPQLRAVNALLRDRTVVAACALLPALVVGTVTLASPATWTSAASFMPATRRSSSNLSGLAAQFGINVPGAEPTQSPPFYAELVMSRELLGGIADSTYTYASDTGQVRATLPDIVVRDRSLAPGRKREESLRWLRDHLVATPYSRTGTIGLTVEAPSPALAQQLLQRTMQGVSKFNLQSRQSQAGAERRFTEGRLEEARQELRNAEERLREFLQSNRDYERAASLRLQFDRLTREVTFRQQILTSLAQSYEQARIDEVRDTPAITMIDEPNAPVKPNPRGTTVKTFAALVAGFMLGCLIAVLRHLRPGPAHDADDRAEFEQLLSATWTDLRHPLRWAARAFRAARGRAEAARG